MKFLLPFLLSLLIAFNAVATQYYLSSVPGEGSDANNGTSINNLGGNVGPWLTATKANSTMTLGDNLAFNCTNPVLTAVPFFGRGTNLYTSYGNKAAVVGCTNTAFPPNGSTTTNCTFAFTNVNDVTLSNLVITNYAQRTNNTDQTFCATVLWYANTITGTHYTNDNLINSAVVGGQYGVALIAGTTNFSDGFYSCVTSNCAISNVTFQVWTCFANDTATFVPKVTQFSNDYVGYITGGFDTGDSIGDNGSGIEPWDADTCKFDHIFLQNCGLQANNSGGPVGFYFIASRNCTLQASAFGGMTNQNAFKQDCVGCGFDIGATNCLIQDVIATNNAGAGFYTANDYGGGNTFRFCVASNNCHLFDSEFRLNRGHNNVIYNCTVLGTSNCLDLTTETNACLTNDIFSTSFPSLWLLNGSEKMNSNLTNMGTTYPKWLNASTLQPLGSGPAFVTGVYVHGISNDYAGNLVSLYYMNIGAIQSAPGTQLFPLQMRQVGP